MSLLVVQKQSFRDRYFYDLHNYFAHSFGILEESGKSPELVRLQYNYE
jgi:hypothetical protein